MSAAAQAARRRGSSGKRRRHSAAIQGGTAGRAFRGRVTGAERGVGGLCVCGLCVRDGTACPGRDGFCRVAGRLAEAASPAPGAARPGADAAADRAGAGADGSVGTERGAAEDVFAPGDTVRAGAAIVPSPAARASPAPNATATRTHESRRVRVGGLGSARVNPAGGRSEERRTLRSSR
ncbi:hypothetical protein [Actinomadura livida]|uniref:Uncharacterized protein n=1 Tax=Actinomadura livida TaxID=79909 RepID=A0A7W7IFU7_9ACTN|nr:MULTISPECIES: hypothetical protein [Actinomadura]MBB4776204.1 hypothetical protein [Actinomadura catellatispora]GGU14735.1 hypothetical protein GCM10010208_44570 [Actinomadura livida]